MKETINQALKRYHGRMPQGFYFVAEKEFFLPYVYDDEKKCLICDEVKIPFDFQAITNEVIDKSLNDLENKVIEYYKNVKGIRIFTPED